MTNPIAAAPFQPGIVVCAGIAIAGPGQRATALLERRTSEKHIIEFVQAVTDQGSKDFVKPEDRIAVFDNDGTLWSEQPMYFELLFALDEVKRNAPQHPEWKTTQPFKAVLENDHKALAAAGMDGMMKIFGATHTGMTTEAFDDYAKTWLSQARHPKTGKPYTEMIFQPMLEMLDYLRSEDFKTYIVSGGDTGFMRAFAEKVYGIPPEQVIGTTFVTVFQYKDGQASILRTQNWHTTTTARANRKALMR
jgi:phosphoserine phosphatase